jgi:predicted transcriptional regulator
VTSTISLPEDVRIELKRVAQEEDRTLSAVIARALRAYFENRESAAA